MLDPEDGDIWTLSFKSSGYYEDYRVTFYLPSDFTVKNVSSSQGLEHLFSASNDSLALDFQGYDVLDPAASIEYQQPLDVSAPPLPLPSYLLPLSLMLILAVGAAAAFWWHHKARSSPGPAPSTWDNERAVRAKESKMPPEVALSSKSVAHSEENDASSGEVALVQPVSAPPEITEVLSDTAAEMEILSSSENLRRLKMANLSRLIHLKMGTQKRSRKRTWSGAKWKMQR
jgi:hypothetical protein